jgi:long-chain acyl-CoA synthetase
MDDRVWHGAYDAGVPAGLDYEPLTMPGFLARSVKTHPGAPALIFESRRMSYRRLGDEVARFATVLSRLGVTRGTRVAIQLPNVPQTVIAYFATLGLGAEVVMTNPLYVERELEHQWNDAGCSVAVVADYLYAGRIQAIRQALPVRQYVIASIPNYLTWPLRWFARIALARATPPLVRRVAAARDVHHMSREIRRTDPDPPEVDVDLDAVAVVQYTGGTTGVSKGAVLTHRNLSANVQQVRAWFTDVAVGREVMLGALPFFHVFGMTVAMNFPIVAASAIVLIPDPRDVRRVVTSIATHRVTLFPGVPAMFDAITSSADADRADLTSVISCFSGGAPLTHDVLTRFERLTGSRIVEGFGLTETSPVTHVNPLHGTRKVGTIGVPLPDTDARIVDPEGGQLDVPTGQPGELLVRGPQVMRGYWRQPEETARTIRDGWLYTGDIATHDEDGYFSIVGRKKEMIIAGGYNIYPDEVDAVLAAHPAVAESATIGVPDARRGETVKSFVVVRAGAAVTADELKQYCRAELAAYKIPRIIEFRDSLPKSTVQKVLRRELRAQEVARASTRESS